MLSVIIDTIKRVIKNRAVYYKRIISVVLSISVVIVIQCISCFAVSDSQLEDNSLKTDTLNVLVGKQNDEDVKDDLLLRENDISSIIGRYGKCSLVLSDTWDDGNITGSYRNLKTHVFSFTKAYFISGEEIVNGSNISEADETYGLPKTIISDVMSRKLYGTEDAVNRKIIINTEKHGILELVISGVYKDTGYNKYLLSDDYLPTIYVNYEYLKKNNLCDELTCDHLQYYVDKTEVQSLKNVLHQHFDIKYSNTDTKFTVYCDSEKVESSDGITVILTSVILCFAVIAFFISNIGIMNMSLMDIAKRKKEIGVQIAIGAQNKQICTQIVTECVFISLVGTFLGIISGFIIGNAINLYVSSRYGNILNTFSVYMPWTSAFYASAGTLIISIVFSVFPAKRAIHLNVIDAIRSND